MIRHTDALAAATTAETRTADIIAEAFVPFARDLGWPDDAVEAVHWNFRDGLIEPEYVHDLVHEWEFGTSERPPAPAIRRFKNRADLWAPMVFESILAGELKLS